MYGADYVTGVQSGNSAGVSGEQPGEKKDRDNRGICPEIFPKQIYTLVKCRATAEDVLKENPENIRITEQRKTIWRVFCGNNATRRYREIAKLLLDRGSNPTREYATWGEQPLSAGDYRALEQSAEGGLTGRKGKSFEANGDLIRKEADHDPSVLKRLQTAKRISLEACLTCFTLTGLTLTCFEQKKDTAELFALKQIVYPFSSDEKEKDRDIQEELRKRLRKMRRRVFLPLKKNSAESRRAKPQTEPVSRRPEGAGYSFSGGFFSAWKSKLYSLPLQSVSSICQQNPGERGAPLSGNEYQLFLSGRVGGIPSFAERSLTYHAKEASSDKTGLCITNCDNEYTEFCLKTMPC